MPIITTQCNRLIALWTKNVFRIFVLQNRRYLDELQTKWWDREKRDRNCTEYDDVADEISVENIGGLFILILNGISISVVAIVLEYLWFKYYKNPKIIATMRRKRIQQYILIHSKMSKTLDKKYGTV